MFWGGTPIDTIIAFSATRRYFSDEVAIDIGLIANSKDESNILLRSPLWRGAVPDEWAQLLAQFKSDLINLNAGYEFWTKWFDDLCVGKPLDVAFLLQIVDVPESLGGQGAAKVNAYLLNLRNATAPLNRVRTI